MTADWIYQAMAGPPDRNPPRAAASRSEFASAGKVRIMVVEDDFLVGLTIEDTLLEAGYEVLALIATGEEAVEKGTQLRPDLVLMDIRLAGAMSGIDAAIQLRAAGIPSLFASAHSDPGTTAAGEVASPLGWLAKPFTPVGLRSAVEDAIARLTAN